MPNLQEQASVEVNPGEMRALLEENIKISREIRETNERIRRYIKVRTIISVIWIVLIVTPIILAIIWLPPFIRDFMSQYQELIGPGQNTLNMFKL